MINVNEVNLSFEEVASGKKAKQAKLWGIMHNVLRIVGFVGSMAAFVSLGLTGVFASIIGCIVVVVGSVFVFKTIPSHKELKEEISKKVDFMIELASNGVTVDSQEFELSQVSVFDARQEAKVSVLEDTEDGILEEKEQVFGNLGNKYKYFMFKDNQDCEHLLVSDEEFFEDRRLLSNDNGYICTISSRMSYGLLEEEDLNALPMQVKSDIANFMGGQPKKKTLKRKNN